MKNNSTDPQQDKISWDVNNMGYGVKSSKNNSIIEVEIPLCTICKQKFYFLQDDAIINRVDDVISRCMNCYGDRFGVQHLTVYLRELGNQTWKNYKIDTGIQLKLLWEYPANDPIIVKALGVKNDSE